MCENLAVEGDGADQGQAAADLLERAAFRCETDKARVPLLAIPVIQVSLHGVINAHLYGRLSCTLVAERGPCTNNALPNAPYSLNVSANTCMYHV